MPNNMHIHVVVGNCELHRHHFRIMHTPNVACVHGRSVERVPTEISRGPLSAPLAFVAAATLQWARCPARESEVRTSSSAEEQSPPDTHLGLNPTPRHRALCVTSRVHPRVRGTLAALQWQRVSASRGSGARCWH